MALSPLDRGNIFPLHFPWKIDEYKTLNPIEGFFDGVTPKDDYWHELNLFTMIQMSRSINVPVVGLFDLFGEMTVEGVVETNPSIPKVTLPLRAQPMVPKIFIAPIF